MAVNEMILVRNDTGSKNTFQRHMTIVNKKPQSSHTIGSRRSKIDRSEAAWQLLEALEEIPKESWGRLDWIIRLVDTDRSALLKEQEKVGRIVHGLMAVLGFAPVDSLPLRPGEQEQEKTPLSVILRIWDRMLRAAVKRQRLDVAEGETWLSYSTLRGRFVEITSYDYSWEISAARALAKLIVEHGHLIKQCPAPRLRAKGECENLFLANRPNQLYCSSQCLSRATTEMHRLPPKQRKIVQARRLLYQGVSIETVRKRVRLTRKIVEQLTPEA